ISPVLNQFKENGVIRDWSNERIVRYILALSLSYVIPMMLNDKEDVNIDEAVNEIVDCLSSALVEVK
ncbi:MAG: TetR/AcrR family transcriptional regulator, partial [Streptococcus cristatus]|nr:TetR/AcrR family transcriptional regulator [Streptococcus cristatus]